MIDKEIERIVREAQARLSELEAEERSVLDDLRVVRAKALSAEILNGSPPLLSRISRLYLGDFNGMQTLNQGYKEQAYLAGRVELSGFSSPVSRVMGNEVLKPTRYTVLVALIEEEKPER